MPESSEVSELPPASPLRRLSETTIDIARRINDLVTYIENTKGHAEVTLIFRRGELVKHRVLREFDDQ